MLKQLAIALTQSRDGKKGAANAATLHQVRLEHFVEGDCRQTLHVGSFANEAPVWAHLHSTVMPEMALTFNGKHHEVYLSDLRRVVPAKRKTILRQPVKPA